MSEYLFIIVWLAAMALFQCFVETDVIISIEGKKKRRKTWWYVILVVSALVFASTFRDRNFTDTPVYISTFGSMPTSFSAFPTFYSGLTKDKWFYAFEALVHIFISEDYRVLFFIIAAIQMYSLAKLYRKYSADFLIAIFIFVTCGDYLSWMHNGIRQFTAVSICLLATTWMIERKYIPAIITIVIASFFHQTALLMIPIFLVCIGEPWNKRTLLVLVLILLSIAFVSQFTNWLDAALDDTQYTNVVTDWKSWNDDGTNPIRVLVYSIPALISIVGLRYIRNENDRVINFCTNMSIVAAGLYLLSMVTSGIFMGRLPIYASLYSNGILLPWEIKNIFNRESSRFIRIAMIIGFVLFYLYQIHYQWRLI